MTRPVQVETPPLALVLTCGSNACGHTFEPDPVALASGSLTCPSCSGWTFQAELVEPGAGRPAAPVDAFAADIAWRCRRAREGLGGHPSPAWSTGEQLAVALVLRDRAHLDAMGYTPRQAAQRVHDGMLVPPADLGAWLEGIRVQLGEPGGGRR
ncbi:MAG: hypothetical protein LC799_34965 [Actinobacteria bacterium]|nr:hypothetical protein [Actinomycetota bacterium]